jgi:hypothetical protein
MGFFKAKPSGYEVTTMYQASQAPGGKIVIFTKKSQCRDKIDVARYIQEHYSFGLWGDNCTITIKKN